MKDEKIHELEEEASVIISPFNYDMIVEQLCRFAANYLLDLQIRDFTVFIEAQKVLDNVGGSNGIKGGTVLPVTAPQPSAGRSRRPTKLNRKRT